MAFNGVKKIASALNPVNAGRPGFHLIKSSLRAIAGKRTDVIEINDMEDEDRLNRAEFLKNSAISLFFSGLVLSVMAAMTGAGNGSIIILVSSVIIFAGTMFAGVARLWEREMVLRERKIGFFEFIKMTLKS